MTILEALKLEEGVNVRVTNGDKWLIWNNFSGGNFYVVQQKRDQKKPRVLIDTPNEDKAVAALLGRM